MLRRQNVRIDIGIRVTDVLEILSDRPYHTAETHPSQHMARAIASLPPAHPQQDATGETERKLNGRGYDGKLKHGDYSYTQSVLYVRVSGGIMATRYLFVVELQLHAALAG